MLLNLCTHSSKVIILTKGSRYISIKRSRMKVKLSQIAYLCIMVGLLLFASSIHPSITYILSKLYPDRVYILSLIHLHSISNLKCNFQDIYVMNMSILSGHTSFLCSESILDNPYYQVLYLLMRLHVIYFNFSKILFVN